MPAGNVLGLLALLFHLPEFTRGWAQQFHLPNGGLAGPNEVAPIGTMFLGISLRLTGRVLATSFAPSGITTWSATSTSTPYNCSYRKYSYAHPGTA